MMLQDYLTNAHLMCFEKRKAYWPQVEADLAHLGIFPQRFVMGSGTDGDLQYDHVDRHKGELPGRQRLNYAEAVKSLLRREFESGAQHIFLSEDDNRLHSTSLDIWEAVLEEAKDLDFDIMFLHAVRIHSRTSYFSKNILRINDGCLGLRAVIMKRPVMEAICEMTPCEAKGIDGLIRDGVHPRFSKIFSAYPCVLRADGADGISHQHEMAMQPFWLDLCINEKGHCE